MRKVFVEIVQWAPWILTIVSFACEWMLGKKLKNAFLVAIFGSLLCIVYNVITKQYGFIPTNLMHVVFSIRNYRLWQADEKAEQTNRGTKTG
jgi:4-hydroxybenzoate polyprenyltransferase